MKTLPECAHMSIAIHVTSPSTALSAAVTVGGRVESDLSECDWPALIKHSCALLNQAADCSDARPMTKEEVREYREDNSHDESEGG